MKSIARSFGDFSHRVEEPSPTGGERGSITHAAQGRGSLAREWAELDLRSLETRGLRRELETLDSPQGSLIQIGGKALINFSSNDYLGLANDPRLVEAAAKAAAAHGFGMGSSRLLVGGSPLHCQLEERARAFFRTEAAVLFNSGYAANLAILASLCGPEDVIFSDALNHASLVDGCRLSRAKTVVYPHLDFKALDSLLIAHPGRRQLVCTESLFSMDGDQAPLVDLVQVCRRHRAALAVDEAHALGIVGSHGRGVCDELGVSEAVDVRMGTLGKAVGAFGAFAATSRPVADLLINRARPLIFSTALPPSVCAAGIEGLRIVQSEEDRRSRLWTNIENFADGIRKLGFCAEPSSAIFPIIFGSAARATAAASQLRERGLLVKAIRPPTVPPGTSRLRFSITVAHTEEQIDLALRALRGIQGSL